eukprot:10699793-Alexandrium_andersonii.AAC.1
MLPFHEGYHSADGAAPGVQPVVPHGRLRGGDLQVLPQEGHHGAPLAPCPRPLASLGRLHDSDLLVPPHDGHHGALRVAPCVQPALSGRLHGSDPQVLPHEGHHGAPRSAPCVQPVPPHQFQPEPYLQSGVHVRVPAVASSAHPRVQHLAPRAGADDPCPCKKRRTSRSTSPSTSPTWG